jgi:hypothetical protein
VMIFATDVFQLPPQDQLAKPHRGRDPSVFRSGTSATRTAAGADQKGAAARESIGLGDSNVWDMIAAWDGSIEALQYQIDSLISWGPFELTAISESFVDARDHRLVACRFRYSGPESEKENLVRSFHVAVARVTDWHVF